MLHVSVLSNQHGSWQCKVEWALFPKTIFYTRSSNGAKLPTSGVSLQVTKHVIGQVEPMCEYIAMMWKKAMNHRGGPLVGKHFIQFGKSGHMGYEVTTKSIHRQNAMLKTIKQRVLMNLNDIDTVIEIELSDTANFGEIGMFTLRDAFLSYTDPSGDSQTGRTYHLLFHEKNSDVFVSILTNIDAKLEAIENWDDIPVHYSYITLDGVEEAGQK
jgi:hypothetical protein